MNKLKFIPVLAVVSLLSACGESGKLASVKAPKFEKEGTEIEVEKFFEDVDKYAMSLDFNNNKRMSSKEIKSSYAYEDVDTYKREKEVLLHTVYQETDDGVIKYDAPHSLISVKGEYGFYNLEEDKAYGNEQREDVNYYEAMYQRVQYGEELCYASVDSKAKAIYMYGVDISEYDVPTLADNIAKEMVFEYMHLSIMEEMLDGLYLAAQSEEGLVDWKIYQNKNIYTVEYTNKLEPQDTVDANDNTVVKFTTERKYEQKLQMKFDGNNLKVAYFFEDSSTRTYKSNYSSGEIYHKEGDVEEMVSREARQAELKEKDISLKEVDYEGFQVLYY